MEPFLSLQLPKSLKAKNNMKDILSGCPKKKEA